MNRTTAMILTIVSILLCGCPGLAACAMSAYAMTIDQQTLIQGMQANGFDFTNVANTPAYLWAAKIIWVIIALVLIAIPIIVGLVTLRRSKKAAV